MFTHGSECAGHAGLTTAAGAARAASKTPKRKVENEKVGDGENGGGGG